jgi:hypothetical protein
MSICIDKLKSDALDTENNTLRQTLLESAFTPYAMMDQVSADAESWRMYVTRV